MKKIVSLTLATLFIMVVAVGAFAADTTFEGQYRVRAWSEWNFDKKPGYGPPELEEQYDGWFDQRFRLTITHTRSEYLKAVIRLDIVEDTWGQGRAFFINNTPAGNYIDWAYLEFTVPPIGTFTLGKFPEYYGHNLIFAVDSPGLDGARWANAWGPVAVSVLFSKVTDNVALTPASRLYNRDTNLFALNLKITPVEGHLIELYGGMAIANTTIGGSRDYLLNYWGNAAVLNSAESAWNLGFVGLSYTGNIADMIDLKLEYGWVLGNVRYDTSFPATNVGLVSYTDASVEGWTLYLDVAYYNELFRVGAAFLMGSGANNYWGPLQYDNVNMNSISTFAGGFTWGNIILNSRGNTNSRALWANWADDAENLTSVKLYFEICPMEKLTLNAAVIWAKWTNPVGNWDQNNLIGTGSAYPHPMAGGNYAYTSWDESTDLGWEIDFGLSYEIMEGLTYTFAAGVLLTGESFDYVDFDGTKESWGPIWSISNVIQYEF